MSSASPLPIRPPSLAAPLLSIPTVTTVTSSQDEILLDINPPPFPVPQRQRTDERPTVFVSPEQPSTSGNVQERVLTLLQSHSTSLLERLRLERTPSHLVLPGIGERQPSPTISVVHTDEEMTLLHPPRRLTNTPSKDSPLPEGWTRELWVPEQVEGMARLC